MSTRPAFAYDSESIEWTVADSDLVFMGQIVEIAPVDASPVGSWHQLTVQIAETFKGPKHDRFTFLICGASDAWLAKLSKKQELVFRLKEYQKQYVTGGLGPQLVVPLPTTSAWALRHNDILDLSSEEPFGPVLNSEDRHFKRRDDLLNLLRESGKLSEDKKPAHGYVLYSPAYVYRGTPVPGGAYSGVYFPVDGRLEAQARKWLTSSKADARIWGIITLQYFRSDENIDLVKGLLNDPEYFTDMEPRKPIPYLPIHLLLGEDVAVRHYPVRRAAYETLQNWGITVPEPITEEPVRGWGMLLIVLGTALALAVIVFAAWRLWYRRRRALT